MRSYTWVVIEPQRYNFLSKSQLRSREHFLFIVVIEPQRYNFLSKSQQEVRKLRNDNVVIEPQRYNFLSKSQLDVMVYMFRNRCYWTTKIQFSKQITTCRLITLWDL